MLTQRKIRVWTSAILVLLPLAAWAQSIDPVQILLRSQTGLRSCYSFDGTGNNLSNPTWGATGEELLREEGNHYIDGDWAQMREGPNPRAISNIMSHETCTEADRTAEPCINDWFWLWGQMVDHDMTHVPTFTRDSEANVTIDVAVPENDPFLSGRTLPMRRSAIGPNNEQVNLASAYLDSSQLYGSSERAARSVRTFTNGMLAATTDGFMPVLSARLNLDHSGVPTFEELGGSGMKDQFLCADMRCNQHAPMAALQAMYVREHNRIATALATARHPAYQTDEAIYQAARAMVIAMNQAVTYNEFLPIMLGRFTPAAYTGYKQNVKATVSNAFATAAFRVPHSMVGCGFREMSSQGQVLRNINFAQSFFDSTWIRGVPAQPNRAGREANAYQSIMHGLAQNASPRMDHKVAPAMRSVLFSSSVGPGGRRRGDVAFDVISNDLMRGRDHGLLDYRRMRRAFGWRDVTRDTDITRDTAKLNILRAIYTDVDQIDLFTGLMLEDPLDGSLMGPVTTSILKDQFERLRDGDRCWYERQFTGQLLQALRSTKLGDLVQRNFNGPASRVTGDVTLRNTGLRTATPLSASPAAPRATDDVENPLVPAPAGLRGPMGADMSNTVIDDRTSPAVDPHSARRRRAENRSGLDNGLGVREAGELDDVIGYRCEGGSCRGLALEDDEEDWEVVEWARRLKEERRRARRGRGSDDAMARAMMAEREAAGMLWSPADGVHGADEFIGAENGMGVFGYGHHASTFQAGAAASAAAASNTDPGQGQRTVLPSQRPNLPPMPAGAGAGNIFLMPRCRG